MTTLLAAALLALVPLDTDVSVDVNSGDTISRQRTFRVTVASSDPVTQVEFYVGSELRDSDTSVPYEFKLDTVEEADGSLQLTFAAYTTKGDSAKKVVNVKVDNEVGAGADVHVSKGIEFLQDSKWDDAILEARIAMKASQSDDRARMIMARSYLGKGVLDKAQKYAEDWAQSQPDNPDAAELLSGIHLHRAFSTLSRGTDRNEALKSIQSAFKEAINTRQRLLESKLQKIGEPSADNVLIYADSAMRAGRYSMAIKALDPVYRRQLDRPEITNRLAYAQVRSGRTQDALNTLKQMEKLSKLDAYGNALMAMVQAISNNEDASTKYMTAAVALDSESLGVKTAQAFLALRAHKTFLLSQVAAELQRDSGARPEVNYYLAALADALNNYGEGRKYFEAAVYTEPLNEEAYLEEGNNSLAFAVRGKGTVDEKKFLAASAQSMFETALEVRPESYRGLLGLALTALLGGEKADGLRYAEAAIKAAPTQASAYYVYAAALAANGRNAEATKANQTSWKFDPKNLEGRSVPNGFEAWSYYYKWDRVPVISAPR
jgi:lipopolysaccharide biosynthesis regulator YciM